MKWKKFTLTTTTEAVDLVSGLLGDIGIEGIEVEDRQPLSPADTKGMFIDILPDLGPDDGVAKVSFYLPHDADGEEMARVMGELQSGLDRLSAYVNLGSRMMKVSETQDTDWQDNWKQYFKPFSVDGILIKPTWEKVPRGHRGKVLVQIDPGTAFGTGQHETTQLCIRQLKKHVKAGDRVLDIGTGSGILGITALKLGAAKVCGTDVDGGVLATVRENLAANGIDPVDFPVFLGDLTADEDLRDMVLGGGYVEDAGGQSQSHESAHGKVAALRDPAQGAPSEEALRDTAQGAAPEAALRDTAQGAPSEAALRDTAQGAPSEEALRDTAQGAPSEAAGNGGIGYDIAVANILADVIIRLAPVVPPFLKPGGVFIVSGIIETKEDAVREALALSGAWDILETNRQADWVAMTLVKKE